MKRHFLNKLGAPIFFVRAMPWKRKAAILAATLCLSPFAWLGGQNGWAYYQGGRQAWADWQAGRGQILVFGDLPPDIGPDSQTGLPLASMGCAPSPLDKRYRDGYNARMRSLVPPPACAAGP